MNRATTEMDLKIGSTILELRLSYGYSRQQLGEKVGVTPQQIAKYEHGQNRVVAGRLWDLAQVFNVPVGYFFERKLVVIKQGQRQCQEIVTAFLKIKQEDDRKLVNSFVKRLSEVGNAVAS